jgi:hypothetical protein
MNVKQIILANKEVSRLANYALRRMDEMPTSVKEVNEKIQIARQALLDIQDFFENSDVAEFSTETRKFETELEYLRMEKKRLKKTKKRNPDYWDNWDENQLTSVSDRIREIKEELKQG